MADHLVPCPCAEFDCCECGRHIISVGQEAAPQPPLCASCLFMPGWFRDPRIREIIDPDHSGEEASTQSGADHG